MIIRIIDTETCGLPPDNAQIVEVATVDLVSLDERETASGKLEWTRGRFWSSLVKPGRAIPPEASAIHHITDEMVKDAPAIDSLRDQIWSGADIYAAHNLRFEREVFGLCGMPTESSSWICTYKTGVILFPDAPSHKNQVLRYWLNLKLSDPALAQPHRALGDAYVTAALLRRYLQSAAPEQLVEESQHPILLPRLHFGEHTGKPIAEVPWTYFDWVVNKSKGPWDEDVLYTAKHWLAQPRGST
ncbi:MAG: hypothetical protein IT537_08630 [Hyphomicrobiales bacterium]|nr:hypothetical protein [Hyphomicrobiales bacterium]